MTTFTPSQLWRLHNLGEELDLAPTSPPVEVEAPTPTEAEVKPKTPTKNKASEEEK